MVVTETMDSMYLENLDEYINDEGKIVTYKWLSLTLGVHTNVAKQMLYHFVTNQRNSDKDDFSVTYMVSGIVAGEDGKPDTHKIMLVREENLAVVKSQMKDVISVHVYSVQKTKLKDMGLLYTANYDKVKESLLTINRYSGIECSAAKIQSTADLAKIHQQNAYHAPPEPNMMQKKKPAPNTTSPKKESQTDTNKNRANNANNKPPGKTNQIASMFARQTKKTDEKKDNFKTEKESNNTPPSAGAKKKGGISAFFNKSPATKKPETPESTKTSPTKAKSDITSPSKSGSVASSPVKTESTLSSPVKTESATSSPVKTESQDSAMDSVEDPIPVKKSSPVKANQQSKLKLTKTSGGRGKNKRKNGKDEGAHTAKRKRIMQLSDSESSSDEEEEEEDPPIPPSPPPELARIDSDSDEEIPSTPQPETRIDLVNQDGKAKKRKLVDKTFMDDDGFFVTKKEYEYVSDSGGEEEPLPPKKTESPQKKTRTSPNAKSSTGQLQKENTKPEKKPQNSPVKTKQSSIMSFFKKKT